MIAPPRLPALESRPGWEMRWQLTLIEPPEPPTDYAGEVSPKPRINVVISVTATKAPDAVAASREFIEATASAVPNLKYSDPEPIVFADTVPGARVDLNFLATPDVRLRQIHLFRLDGVALSQLVITGEFEDTPEALAEIEQAALQFTPP